MDDFPPCLLDWVSFKSRLLLLLQLLSQDIKSTFRLILIFDRAACKDRCFLDGSCFSASTFTVIFSIQGVTALIHKTLNQVDPQWPCERLCFSEKPRKSHHECVSIKCLLCKRNDLIRFLCALSGARGKTLKLIWLSFSLRTALKPFRLTGTLDPTYTSVDLAAAKDIIESLIIINTTAAIRKIM